MISEKLKRMFQAEDRLDQWRAERKKTATHAMHAHGQGKGRGNYDPGNPKSKTYRVKGLRP